jgi:hypothetical protein
MIEESELDPWRLFLNAMRSPVTKDRYSTRIAKFFEFIRMPGGTLERKARTFAKKRKERYKLGIKQYFEVHLLSKRTGR